MDSLIERLRNKPTHVRHTYAAGASLAIVAIIFVVWISVRLPGFTGSEQVVADATVRTEENESLFSSFRSSMAQVMTGFETVVDSAKNIFVGSEEYRAEDNQ